MYTTLISVAQLQTLQRDGQPLMVFDCSFELSQPAAGDAQYAQAHIVKAVRADLDRHLSAHGAPDAASGGRHPLPSRGQFAAWVGSVGLTPGMQAVVYDRQGVNYCGRLWWMLKWLGHEAVAVLDGGFAAWQAANGAVETGAEARQNASGSSTSNYPLAQEDHALVATNTVVNNLGKPCQTIVDARGAPRFRGEVEPLDPVAGHIPGALNRVFSSNLDAQGFFKSPAALRAEFDALLAGRDPATVVHHCGSGVSAVPNIIAMELAGYGPSALYAGSWSEWCSDPSRPMAQG
ncbi:MAG: sulfurtransferase [Rhodoferax sp.]|nr:sulfurtransferase [Rhodoferax sp.]OIP22109.1 MAG: sulfurtransferase [Comamonadaceae bacterium CG2_30_60_41]PIW08266.1 MAG: sulfurtransferase [Comamonadaceae bacterium CG17_big_fil_post_rev_8_21_14_2_50_60_13]PIY23896.1 MAG: sulfurtransferase [Comamonadaceae bacterium CG_4_10_14_3_um_filter_60_75]PJC15701.1 MAG: sulfurtransferase [Comamonadaceae bacterium CG_4_9_14_0_8_um_filter_60_18]